MCWRRRVLYIFPSIVERLLLPQKPPRLLLVVARSLGYEIRDHGVGVASLLRQVRAASSSTRRSDAFFASAPGVPGFSVGLSDLGFR